MAAQSPLKLRIDGMDCGACAVKIENAMRNLPGVSDVSVSYSGGSLSLRLDEDRTSRKTVEARISSLGFTASGDGDSSASGRGNSPVAQGAPWWASRKGQLVLVSGALLLLAYAVSLVAPAWSFWAFLAATLVGLAPIARRAVAAALTGTPFTIETLMSIAAIGAMFIGASEEAALVVLLFAIGELLEGVAAGRARAGIEALIRLAPRTALRIRDGVTETTPVEDLAVGDLILVRAGDRVASDGVVIEGASEINEAPVTGESVPVPKAQGDTVYAGTINANGELRIEITKTAADNTLARIIHMVEEAQATKAPTARFIDSFSRWYTPAAMLVAALVIVGPPLVLGEDWSTWIYRGLSLLLIACPCALVISTPAAIASGLANGARRGLLIKGGGPLEMLARVRTVAFDKTGTLTAGAPQVTDIVTAEGVDEADLMAKAAAVEQGSSHPLGIAIVAETTRRNLAIPKLFGGSVATPGKSIMGRLKSGFVTISSPRHTGGQVEIVDTMKARIAALESEGKTVVVVAEGQRMLGLVALRDEPRADAAQGLARLREMDLRMVMLTGDNARAGGAIASGLGLEVKAELLPGAKLDLIAAYKAEAPIAMVGDGINDAPALAAASVGIAMGEGSDVALETADAALLRNRVEGVADLIALARATMANIWQNVSLALGLKAVFLVTSLTGLSTLWMAILADTGATVLVTANALRLLRLRGPRG